MSSYIPHVTYEVVLVLIRGFYCRSNTEIKNGKKLNFSFDRYFYGDQETDALESVCWDLFSTTMLQKKSLSIELNSIRLGGPAHQIVIKTVHKTLPMSLILSI